jgi:hypothetical protein
MSLYGPRIHSAWKLTGSTRHRFGFRGKAILQVEEARKIGHGYPVVWKHSEARYRDATIHDFVDDKLFALRASTGNPNEPLLEVATEDQRPPKPRR